MEDSTSLWQNACKLLTDTSVGVGLERTFPEPTARLSLVAALTASELAGEVPSHDQGQELSQHLTGLIAQAQTIQRIGKCPVVGITGLLNSGKSSLLAAYLSPEGRRRVLRGTANNQGTHRFVLWLPEAWWGEPSLLGLLTQLMTDLFGVSPERLSDDADRAFAQYNGQLDAGLPAGTDPLTVPLLAHDPALDGLGLALLDCPDIQSAFGGIAETVTAAAAIDALEFQHRRRAILGRVGRLCSAFLVVSKLSSLHDETLIAILETLRATMPGVRRILAVNKVKARYGPEVVDEQAQGLVDRFKITDVYMAYDFRSHWAEARLPQSPANLLVQAGDRLPIFFKARRPAGTASATERPSAPLDQLADLHGMRPPEVASYLQDLSSLLDPGRLVNESRRSVLEQLSRYADQALDWVNRRVAQRERQLHDAWQTIADSCLAFMAQRDDHDQTVGLRLQTSPAIVAQMSDSLVRAAPWSMRPSLLIDRSIGHLQTSIAGGVRRVRWLQSVSSSLSQFVAGFRKGQSGKVVTADRFQAELERCDRRQLFSSWPSEALRAACEHALTRFQKEDTSRLDSQWLDHWSVEVWQHMPLKRRLYVGMMPLAPIFGPLLAVTLIPFDGGGTAVLVFATTKELLLAAGIAAVATPTIAGGEVQDIVERETALTQLSDLFAITCDALGVPRPAAEQLPQVKIAGVLRDLSSSQLPVRASATASSLSQWRLAEKFCDQLDRALQALHHQLDRPPAEKVTPS